MRFQPAVLPLFVVGFLFHQPVSAVPIDVDGDGVVGPLELVDFSLNWKGPGFFQPWQQEGANIYYALGNVNIGAVTAGHLLRLFGGPHWTSNFWSGSLQIANAGAIAWDPNGSGQSFGIGQSGGGLYFFRSFSPPANIDNPANYDLTINDFGNVTISKFLDVGANLTVDGSVGIGTAFPSLKLDVRAFSGAISGQTTNGTGVSGTSTSGFGIYGQSTSNVGIWGESAAPFSAGMYGVCPYIGVQGITTAASTDGGRQGVRGDNHGSVTGWAGYFNGNLGAFGTLFKGGGAFRIDHPLDPENKYLNHSFVESPDMMNIYNGNVVLDKDGGAEVVLPDWFMALNRDFRYQLTPIGGPGPNLHIAQTITDGRFRIAGGQPGLEVSWQVTGIRQDAFANARRIQVEEDKPADEKGKYLHPEYHGKDKSQGIPLVTGAVVGQPTVLRP